MLAELHGGDAAFESPISTAAHSAEDQTERRLIGRAMPRLRVCVLSDFIRNLLLLI